MRKLFRDHLKRLYEEKISLEDYLTNNLVMSETLFYAGVKLGLAWCELKIVFWTALIGELQE
jgi:small basic protein